MKLGWLVLMTFIFVSCGQENETGTREVSSLDEVNSPTESNACPADARSCPDGSASIRTGPECEFRPCPGETKDGEIWGYDINGQMDSCVLINPSNLYCDYSIKDGDLYANKCASYNATPFLCGCHEYLCSERVPYP